MGLSLERRATISPNMRAGRVIAPLVSTAAGRLVWMPRLRSKPVRLRRPVPASAVSSTLASTGWVGRVATARLTSWRLALSSAWEQTSFMEGPGAWVAFGRPHGFTGWEKAQRAVLPTIKGSKGF